MRTRFSKSNTALMDERNRMVGLEKGLAVIECFGEQTKNLTIAQVAETVGISSAAARRCLLTLTNLGYAEYDGKFFRLAVRAMRLGYSYLSSISLPQILQSYSEHLREQTHESCSGSLLDQSETVYIARAEVKRILEGAINIGTRQPAFCTSMGRVLLAGLEPVEAERRLVSTSRPKFTKHTITDVSKIMEALDDVRNKGYALVKEELATDLLGLAMPIFNRDGEVVAAINVSCKTQRHTPEDMLEDFLPKLIKTQNAIGILVK